MFAYLTIIAGALLGLGLALSRTSGLARIDAALLGSISTRFGPRDIRRSHKTQTALRDLTALGGDALTLLLLAIAAIGFWLAGRTDDLMPTILVIGFARFAGVVLKAGVRRERPPADGHHIRTYTNSFPSIHTLMAFANSFALGFAALHGVASIGALLVGAATLSALVGWTRLYFAVHWPSDVVAGWLAGWVICASFAWLWPL